MAPVLAFSRTASLTGDDGNGHRIRRSGCFLSGCGLWLLGVKPQGQDCSSFPVKVSPLLVTHFSVSVGNAKDAL